MYRQSGYSLLEVIIAIALLGITMIPTTNMFIASYEGTSNVGYYDQAFFLAQDILEEITSKEFEDPIAAPGSFGTEEGDRTSFNDVDDFDNYGPNSPPITALGVVLVDYSDFSRSVSVVNVEDVSAANMPRANLTPTIDGSTGFKLVTVTVSWDNGKQSQVLERIIANY